MKRTLLALFTLSLIGSGMAAITMQTLAARLEQPKAILREAPPAPTRPVLAPSEEDAVAKRAQKRLQKRFNFSPDLHSLTASIRAQRKLLESTVTVTFATEPGRTVPAFEASPSAYAGWLKIDASPVGITTTLHAPALAAALQAEAPAGITYPVDAVLKSVTQKDGYLKAETEGLAKPGDDFDPTSFAAAVTQAAEKGTSLLTLALHPVAGKIINETGQDLGALTLLATGHSNFEGSGGGRKSNVRKGLNTYLNNTMIASADTFGINSIIKDVPISAWEMALGIFNGHELRPIPGGGLCQVATTLYRAALNGGLPILKRANHSLYVHYYEKYGVGIDATIFPGKQDLAFQNPTNSPLLIQSYTEGDEAFVHIYGTPDGRTATLDGPYFSANAPDSLTVDGRELKKNEIVWIQKVRLADGTEEDHTIVSRYNSVPHSVVTQYLHAAAGARLATE